MEQVSELNRPPEIRAARRARHYARPLPRACPTKGVRDLCRALCRLTLSKMARNRTVRQSVRQRLATKRAEQIVLGQALPTSSPLRLRRVGKGMGGMNRQRRLGTRHRLLESRPGLGNK